MSWCVCREQLHLCNFCFVRPSEPSPCTILQPSHRLSSTAPPFLTSKGYHHSAQYSIWGLNMSYKTTRLPLSLCWKRVIRDTLRQDLPFMVGSRRWQYSSWLAQWPSVFSSFSFPAEKFPGFSANFSALLFKLCCSLFFWSLSHCHPPLDSTFFCLISSSSATLTMPPILVSPANFKRTISSNGHYWKSIPNLIFLWYTVFFCVSWYFP